MALVLDWQKRLGYSADPFVDQPFYKAYLAGLTPLQKRINLFVIKRERLGIIRGVAGSGKTTLLRWIESGLKKGNVRTYLLDARQYESREKLFTHLFELMLSFLERNVARVDQKRSLEEKEAFMKARFKTGHHILLIDHAGALKAAHLKLLAELLKETKAQIILADQADRLKRVSYPIQPTLRESLRKYPPNALLEILQHRITACGGVGTFPFDEKELKRLIKQAEGNPRMLLKQAHSRAMELALKVEGPPKKPKQDDGFSFKLFGKRIRIPTGETREPQKTGSGKRTPGKKPKKKSKKGGFFSISVEKEHKRRATEDEESEAIHVGPAPKPPAKEEPAEMAHDASEDAEQLAELIENASPEEVEIEIEQEEPGEIEITTEEPAKKPKKGSRKKTSKKGGDIIDQIVKEVEKKKRSRKR